MSCQGLAKKTNYGKFKPWLDSWWFDSGSTTHIVVSFQGFRNLRGPNLRENKIRVGNDLEVCVEKVEDVSLVLAFDLNWF